MSDAITTTGKMKTNIQICCVQLLQRNVINNKNLYLALCIDDIPFKDEMILRIRLKDVVYMSYIIYNIYIYIYCMRRNLELSK